MLNHKLFLSETCFYALRRSDQRARLTCIPCWCFQIIFLVVLCFSMFPPCTASPCLSWQLTLLISSLRFLPDVSFPPAAAAVSGWSSEPNLQSNRPVNRQVAGMRPLPTWHIPGPTLHVDAQDPVFNVCSGNVHGAVELHPEVPALRSVRRQPGGEDGVRPRHQLQVRVHGGLLLQGELRHVSAPQKVWDWRRSTD